MYNSGFILLFLYTSTFQSLAHCAKAKNENTLKSEAVKGPANLAVSVTHVGDSNLQNTTHRDENVKSHSNYTPVTFTGSKVPPWDYGRHGSDWTHGMCSAGFKQSPVDLHVEGLAENTPSNLKAVYDSVLKGEVPNLSANAWKRGDVVYSYNHYLSTLQVLRSSNVFRLTVPQNEGSTFGALFTTDKPNLYSATHIDFHSPSEHTFDGSANRRQIEMQIWHYLSDSPTSDMGIASIDTPETTEVNMLVTSAFKKKTDSKKTPQQPADNSTNKSPNTTPNTQNVTRSASNTHTVLNSQTTATTPKTLDMTHFNLTHSGAHEGAHEGAEEDFHDDEEPEFYFESQDHGPSMMQLTQKVSSSDFPHPLNSDKSAGYKKLLENDRYDLFNKYLLTHLNNAANNLNNEQTHVREKKMARDKNTHWGRWAVISLTFMSEEIEKTNIESLRSFPSERFMNEVFKAGSSVSVNESDSYTSVGDLNANHGEQPLPVVDLDVPLNLSSLFMMLEVKNVNYFAYDGSFTQPGCEETVRWYVAKESLPISTELMLQLHRMLNPNPHVSNPNNYVDNYRELQNVNNKCRNVGKVRFIHGYPMEYFVISPFNHNAGEVSDDFRVARASLVLSLALLLLLI